MFRFIKRVGFLYFLEFWFVRTHFTIWHRIRIIGSENIPLSGGVILAANHASHHDSPSIGCAIPRRVRYIADEAMFKKFFLKWYLPRTGGVSITRGSGKGGEMIKVASEVINGGDLLIIYPEGTRTRSGYPGPARTGMIVIAEKTGAPIVPARASGIFDCMPPGSKFPMPGPIQVAFGKPIRFEPGEIDLNDRKKMIGQAAMVMEAINSLPGWHPKRAKMSEDEWRKSQE